MIVVTLGPDAAACRIETNRVVREHDPEAANTTRVDGKSVRLADVLSMVSTPAFFGSGRVIMIDDLLSRSSGESDDPSSGVESDKAKSNRPLTDLSPLFRSVHPGNLLLLVEPSLSRVPKSVAKQLPTDAQIIPGEPPRGHALIKWMQDRAAASGASLNRDAAQLLAEMLFPQTWAKTPSNPRYDRPPNLDQLANEIARLALFAYPDPIARNHVRELAGSALADRLFSFVEQSIAGNLDKAVMELESFDIHGDDAHRAANQLYQQIELSTVLASSQAADPVGIGRELGLSNPHRMYGVARAPRPSSPAEAVLKAVETDRSIKSGRLKAVDDAIYSLITDLAEAKRHTQERRDRS